MIYHCMGKSLYYSNVGYPPDAVMQSHWFSQFKKSINQSTYLIVWGNGYLFEYNCSFKNLGVVFFTLRKKKKKSKKVKTQHYWKETTKYKEKLFYPFLGNLSSFQNKLVSENSLKSCRLNLLAIKGNISDISYWDNKSVGFSSGKKKSNLL